METAAPGGSGGLLLNGRYSIQNAHPLPQFDRIGGRAFQVLDLRQPERPLYALMCDPRFPVRQAALRHLSAHYVAGMACPVEHGMLETDGGPFYAIVFDRPQGEALVPGQVSEEEVKTVIVPALLAPLAALHKVRIPHRAIRPSNIFAQRSGTILLGECCSGAPGREQPNVYEPLESQICPPDGRGEIDVTADYYALGVTIIELLTGNVSGSDMDPQALAAAKVVHGSFAVLTQGKRFSPVIRSLLVGLLADDESRRWKAENIKRWLDGFWDASIQPITGRRAPHPYHFMEQKYVHPALIAMALARHPREAMQELQTDHLERWIRSSLADGPAADIVHRMGKASSGAGSRTAEIISRVCSALDPVSPIRFHDTAVNLSGLGFLLAAAYANDDRKMITNLADLMRSTLLVERSTTQRGLEGRLLSPVIANMLVGHMNNAGVLGFGTERCLYQLNEGFPCQSPILEGRAPITLHNLVKALDAAASSHGGETMLIDRHVAGFIAARSDDMEKYIKAAMRLGEGSLERKLAMIELLGDLQDRFAPEPLPGLCAWTVKALKPVVAKLHSAIRREALSQRLEKLAKGGRIKRLLKELNLQASVKRDESEYKAAIRRFRALGDEIEAIDNGAATRRMQAFHYGYWGASLIAFTILSVSLLVVLGKGFF